MRMQFGGHVEAPPLGVRSAPGGNRVPQTDDAE